LDDIQEMSLKITLIEGEFNTGGA